MIPADTPEEIRHQIGRAVNDLRAVLPDLYAYFDDEDVSKLFLT